MPALLKKKEHTHHHGEEKKRDDAKKRTLSAREAGILIQPVVTEKSAAAGSHRVSFFVPLSANKIEIARAINGIYGIEPLAVRTIRIQGKWKKNRFTRSLGKRSDMKKAIITLPEGAHIDVFDNV